MALTFTLVKGSEWVAGRVRGAYYEGTFTGTYPTGGETVVPRDMGLLSILGMQVVGGNAASGRLLYHFDTANNKLIVLYPTGGAGTQGAALADPAITVAGTGQNPIIPGQGKEITNATPLTTISIRCRIEGFQ